MVSLLSPSLQAFLSVARVGTVHGAASELHLTQTGVTQRIRAIEKDLGTTLFLRSRRGMQLTHEGEALLRYCRAAEDLEGQAFSEILGAATNRPLIITISGPTSVMTARVADQCAHLYSKWAQLHLNLMICDEVDRLNSVRSGKSTFVIISPEQVPNEMDSKRLRPEKYILVGAPQWKGRRLVEILENERVIDFNEDDSTTFDYLKKFELKGHLKKQRLFVNSNETIAKYFSQGIGFGTLTQEIARPHLDAGRLIALNGGAVMEQSLALAWYPRPEMPAYFKAIISVIK